MSRDAMPVALIVVSLLLAVQAIAALRAGHVSAAGICVGGLAFAVGNLWKWYRTHGGAPAPVPAGARVPAPPRAPGSTLVAFVYPDQVDGVGDLFASVDAAARDIVVLAVDAPALAEEPRSGAAPLAPESIPWGRDPRLTGPLASIVTRARRPVQMMRAFGPDPAVVVLDAARELRSARVVVLGAEDESHEEQRRRCAAAWARVPSPRPALRVDLVAGGGAAPVTLELAPDEA